MGHKKGPVKLSPEQVERFELLWKAYPNHTSKGEAKRAFLKYDPDMSELTRWITAVHAESAHKTQLRNAGKFCPEWKHLSTWINQECFDDDHHTTTKDKHLGDQYNHGNDPAPFEDLS